MYFFSTLTVPYRVGCDGSPGQGNNCCTSQNQCGEIEGDCDSDSDCFENLKCGTDNCPIQGNLIMGTVESRFDKARFKKDCCYNRFFSI